MSVSINGTGSITGIDQGFNVTTGSVGIGTDNPQANLHIFEGTGSTQAPAASGNNLVVDSNNEVGMSLLFGTDANTAYGNIYWGNSTDGSADGRITYFGSTYTTAADRQAMVFRTANTERLRITSAGKVGIGTDVPKQFLSVVGRATFDQAGDYYGAWINGNSTADSSFNVGAWYNVGGRLRDNGNHVVLESMNTSHYVQLQPSGGNVGVGEAGPNVSLHVTKDNDVSYTPDQATQNSNNQIKIENHSTTADSFVSMAMRSRACDFHLGVKNDGDTNAGRLFLVHQDTTNTEVFSITSAGNVGINETNPIGDLSITGANGSTMEFQPDIVSGTNRITNFNRSTSTYKAFRLDASQHEFFTSGTERLRIDSTGSIYAGGSVITNADMNWGHDTYQRPHIFTGAIGGNPSDGCLVLASPETNPGGTRIGSIVFGCKTSSASGVNNSGIKATIECNTNNNTSDAWKTGASMTFKTRPNNGNVTAAQTIHHNGNITKPLQPAFRALTTGFSKNNNWQKITFGTENYDIGGYYDHANNKFTAPVAGRYVFYAGGWSSSNSTDSRYAFCARVNGGGLHYLAGAHYGNVDSPMAGYSVIHNLAANDYVEMWGYSAVATTWGGGSHYMFWGGYLLG